MRHRKRGRKLKRTASHRKSMLASLATSLLRHKKITTTVAKAKETRVVVEKLITRSKRAIETGKGESADTRSGKFVNAAGHARREAGRMIRDRQVITELFGTIAPKVANRPGGYTRIVKLGQRQGDGAELAVIELVDFQAEEGATEKSSETKAKKATPKRKKKSDGKDVAESTAKKKEAAAAS